MATLLFRGRNEFERADVLTPSGLHLRVRAGDVVDIGDDGDVGWLLASRYPFVRTEEPARRAVSAYDVQHDASVQLGGQ